MAKKGLSKKDLSILLGRMDWQYLEGTIELTLEVKTQQDLEERLNEIAKQIITQNKDVYSVSHKLKKRIHGLRKSSESD